MANLEPGQGQSFSLIISHASSPLKVGLLSVRTLQPGIILNLHQTQVTGQPTALPSPHGSSWNTVRSESMKNDIQMSLLISLLKEWKLYCKCYQRMFFILGFRSWWIMYKGFSPPFLIYQFQMIEPIFFQLCRHQLSSCLSLVQLSPQSSRRHAVSFTWRRGESLTLYSIQNIFNKLYIITRQCSLLVSHQEDNEETACLMVQLN